MDEKKIWCIYSTFPNRAEALSVSGKLLEKRLIACANLFDNITSLYRWDGAVQQASEVGMIAKTSSNNIQLVIEAVKNLHSYEVPCIIACPIAEGFPPFLQWVTDEVEHKK